MRGLHFEEVLEMVRLVGPKIRRGLNTRGLAASAQVECDELTAYTDDAYPVYQINLKLENDYWVLVRLYGLAYRDWCVRLELNQGGETIVLGIWLLLSEAEEQTRDLQTDSLCPQCLGPLSHSDCSEAEAPAPVVLLDPQQDQNWIAQQLADAALDKVAESVD